MPKLLKISDYMNEIHAWIENNIETQAGLDTLSKRLGYSKRAIQIHFKNEYNISIGRYIQRRRLQRASIMLRMTNMSVIDISSSLHYSSHNNFCRAFKKCFNVTPSQFRSTVVHKQPAIAFPSTSNIRDITFEIKHIPNSIVYGEGRSYTDCIYNTGLAEEKFNWIKRHFLKNKTPITIASKAIPNTFSFLAGKSGRVKYSAIIYDTLTHPTINTHHSIGGLYLHHRFDGTLNCYRKYNADIYRHILPNIGMTQRYARKIEVFHHIEETAHGPFIRCEQLIPIAKMQE